MMRANATLSIDSEPESPRRISAEGAGGMVKACPHRRPGSVSLSGGSIQTERLPSYPYND